MSTTPNNNKTYFYECRDIGSTEELDRLGLSSRIYQEIDKMASIKYQEGSKLGYPHNEEFDYVTQLEIIDYDVERMKDLSKDNGFVITEPQSVKKDTRSLNSIYSSRYGPSLDDDSLDYRTRCECGRITSVLYKGTICPICKTPVTYIGDNFKYTGWIVIQEPYFCIHMNLYKCLEHFIGEKNLTKILKYELELDINGLPKPRVIDPKEPFVGIGMTEFAVRLEEILLFYLNKNKTKRALYDHITAHIDRIFTRSIPVYTVLLRPYRLDGDNFTFEETNSLFNIIARLVSNMNKLRHRKFVDKKASEDYMFALQFKLNKLYTEVINILAQKKGVVRQLCGGRHTHTSRLIIVPDNQLDSDEIKVSYYILVDKLQNQILNILMKSYTNNNMTLAKKILRRAMIEIDDRVKGILLHIINHVGLEFIINRPPSIQLGSILFMKVVGINDNFTMSLPLRVLQALVADFDGDCLTVFFPLNEEVRDAARRSLNPRNALQISLNDGLFNNVFNFTRDTWINVNAFLWLSRDYYTKDQLDLIKLAKVTK